MTLLSPFNKPLACDAEFYTTKNGFSAAITRISRNAPELVDVMIQLS